MQVVRPPSEHAPLLVRKSGQTAFPAHSGAGNPVSSTSFSFASGRAAAADPPPSPPAGLLDQDSQQESESDGDGQHRKDYPCTR